MSDSTNDLAMAMKIATIYFQSHLKHDPAASYVKTRGLSQQMLSVFKIGYAPDEWRGLVDHFSAHQYRLAAKDAGLIGTQESSERMHDFFRGRLMFPIRDAVGATVGYAGRLIEPSNAAKYMNTPETALFKKGQMLYGLYENGSAISRGGHAALVEGYMDVITMAGHGFDIGLAPMGTAFTAEQYQLVLERGVREFTICLDGDNAGVKAAKRTLDIIMDDYRPEMAVRFALLPDGHDPDSLLRETGPEAFSNALAAALPLHDYIHLVCALGHRVPASIEDQAEYMIRIEHYMARAPIELHRQLMALARNYTGLDESVLMQNLPQCTVVTEAIDWDNTTMLAARWLVHDTQLQTPIAKNLAAIQFDAIGLGELRELANQYLNGVRPSGRLHEFATVHGGLMPNELQQLRGDWNSWMTRAALTQGLSELAKNPFDERAKSTVKIALR